ncbi:bleomycin resistance protein [Devosia sp. Leaf420]|uniref:VOC family protein n=1 Tax=Devosia sp. Leaf420 TaxID=1736374 RepID=UPI0007133CF6|nr:VOC family protein [Devosia sp. Leaf420]KQT45927.1 bleomycin resistance protein [Devosia sp. Leaf420]
MSITTTTHLNFRGQAREALAFYQSVFGGEVMILTHSQIYPTFPTEEADHVAFGQVRSPEGFHIMAFDVPAARPFDPGITPIFVSVHGTDADEITRYWNALAAGATIVQPLAAAGWAPLYGMLSDRFGITWVLDVANTDAP